jgi:hypothetical protein
MRLVTSIRARRCNETYVGLESVAAEDVREEPGGVIDARLALLLRLKACSYQYSPT